MSATSAARLSSSPDAAESFSLSEPTLCVVQLKHQAPGVVHQAVLDPAKIKDGLIRLGEWPGDEAFGWQYIDSVIVLVKLGHAAIVDGKTQVSPLA